METSRSKISKKENVAKTDRSQISAKSAVSKVSKLSGSKSTGGSSTTLNSSTSKKKKKKDKLSKHLQEFVDSQQSEIQRMKEEQQDMDLLQQRFTVLQEKYTATQLEMQKLQDWGQTEISNSKFVIDQLRSELKELQQESHDTEASQLRIIDTIVILSKDVFQKSQEVAHLRQKIDTLDTLNLGERKEIHYSETILKDLKSESHQNHLELTRLRNIDEKLSEFNKNQTKMNTKLKADSKEADQLVNKAHEKINSAETKTVEEMAKSSKFTKQKLEFKTKKQNLEKQVENVKKENQMLRSVQETLFRQNEFEFCKRNDQELRLQELRVLDHDFNNEEASLTFHLEQYHQQVATLGDHEKNLHYRFAELSKQMVGLKNQNDVLKNQLERQGVPLPVVFVEQSAGKSSNNARAQLQSIRSKIDSALSISKQQQISVSSFERPSPQIVLQPVQNNSPMRSPKRTSPLRQNNSPLRTNYISIKVNNSPQRKDSPLRIQSNDFQKRMSPSRNTSPLRGQNNDSQQRSSPLRKNSPLRCNDRASPLRKSSPIARNLETPPIRTNNSPLRSTEQPSGMSAYEINIK